MSSETMTSTLTTPARSGALARYGRRWAGTPRALLYLVVAFPLATASFAVAVALFSAGVGTIAAFLVGIFVLIAGLYVARAFGTLELRLLRWAGAPPIEAPDWRDRRARSGFRGWLGATLGNPHYWLHLLWAIVVDFVVSVVTFSVAVTWVATTLGGLTFWFWSRFLPNGPHQVYPAHWLLETLGVPLGDAAPLGVEIVAYLVVGVVFAFLTPFVLRGLMLAHWGVARGMLGAFRSDALRRQVTDLAASRSAAVAAEDAALRRLERDIHDGPQQRLVRLQMDLAAADRQLDSDPAATRALIAEALAQSKDALDELRALSQGFAPPILLDRGLVAALESLASRGAVPIRLTAELSDSAALPPELERNAYFIVAESVTNAAKHAGATHVDLVVALRRDPGEPGGQVLEISVTDDGRGGAVARPGHGIANLQERAHGLGGTLAVTSPVGGPTTVSARIPVGEPR
jgi:signal transduction histidine kinase